MAKGAGAGGEDLERLLADFRTVDRAGSGLLPEGQIRSVLCRIGLAEQDAIAVIEKSACSTAGGMASYPELLRWLFCCGAAAENASTEVRVAEAAAADVVAAPEEEWSEKYNDVNTLADALISGDTALIKGSWFLEFVASGGALPRRQDLPPGALWDGAELAKLIRENGNGDKSWNYWEVVPLALSYCWATKEHPDPTGEQIRRLARAVRAFHSKARHTSIRDTALFIDWASLFQEPRSTEEVASFKRGLRDVNLWYAHRQTISLLLTTVPEGVKPYQERGWPTFEFNISCLAKNPTRVLDLGATLPEPDAIFEDFDDIRSQLLTPCKAHRPPPCSPDTFKVQLKSLHFTSGSDRDFVMKKYLSTFQEVMGSIPDIYFPQLNWNAEDAKEMASVMLWCKRAEALDVGESKIGPEGARHLASALPKCPSLRTIDLGDCCVKDEGLRHLLAVLPQTNLRNLWMAGNDLADDAVDLLVDFITGERRQLYELSLRNNPVTDAGAARLAAALCQEDCKLYLLRLRECRRLTDASVEALCEALRKSPSLKTLDMRGTSGMTAAGRDSLLAAAKLREGVEVLR